MKRLLESSLVVLVLVTAGEDTTAQPPDSFHVIAHPDVEVVSVSQRFVSNLFLKKVTRWDDGSTAVPVDQSRRSEIRQDFSLAIHGRDSAHIQSYWQRQVFSGRELPPPEMTDDDEVIVFVKTNPGAIGYVARGARVQGVRVLTVAGFDD